MNPKLVLPLGIIFVVIGGMLLPLAWLESHLEWIPSCTGSGGHWGPRQFWRGLGVAEPWDSAPNGWYWVQSGWESENGTVTFPLCPSSGTRLHGTWNTIIYLEDNFAGYVRVENNVIVESRT